MTYLTFGEKLLFSAILLCALVLWRKSHPWCLKADKWVVFPCNCLTMEGRVAPCCFSNLSSSSLILFLICSPLKPEEYNVFGSCVPLLNFFSPLRGPFLFVCLPARSQCHLNSLASLPLPNSSFSCFLLFCLQLFVSGQFSLFCYFSKVF